MAGVCGRGVWQVCVAGVCVVYFLLFGISFDLISVKAGLKNYMSHALNYSYNCFPDSAIQLLSHEARRYFATTTRTVLRLSMLSYNCNYNYDLNL